MRALPPATGALSLGTVHYLTRIKSLEPAELLIAASAYEAVSESLSETSKGGSASQTTAARHILRNMFDGERNVGRLRDGALAEVGHRNCF